MAIKIKEKIIHATLIAIFPIIVILVISVYTLINYPLSPREISQKMESKDIVASVQNQDIMFFIIRATDGSSFYWYDLRFETEYQMMSFSRGLLLPRYELYSHWPLSSIGHHGQLGIFSGGWHKYEIEISQDNDVDDFLKITRLGFRPFNSIALLLTLVLLFTGIYIHVYRLVRSGFKKS